MENSTQPNPTQPNPTQPNPNESIMHYTFPTKAKEIQFSKIVKALSEINAKDSLNNLKNFESVLDNTLKRAKLILDASEIAGKDVKQETFAKLISFTLPMVKKYLALGKELRDENSRAKIDEFKALNKGRLDKKQPVTYGIDAITKHLKGEKVYLTDDEIQAKKDQAENERTKKQAENKAKAKPKAEPNPEAEAKPNEAHYVFNPVLFGFENDSIEDITLNIIHSPKNTAKPYIVSSNVPSFVLRAMFDKILRHTEKCEADLERIKQYEADPTEEAEIEDANFDLSGHEHIRFVIAK